MRSHLRIVSAGEVLSDEAVDPTAEYVESFYLFERELTDALRTGAPLPQAGVDNLRTLEATFSAYAAADTGRMVALQ